jgi:4-amino-4-deoxy-L-arabinose transferase-like glycosyltransferase
VNSQATGSDPEWSAPGAGSSGRGTPEPAGPGRGNPGWGSRERDNPGRGSRDRSRLTVVLALALLVRLVAVLAIDDPHKVPRTLAESDAPTYYVLAEHILDGTGYRYAADKAPTAKRTPGYPLFLAAVFEVFGESFSAVRVIQCLLDVATTFLVYTLAVLVFGSISVGLVAAFGYAFYLPAILSSTYIMTETTYTLFLVLAVTAAVLAMRLESYLMHVFAGVAFGVSSLIRPGAFLLPPVLLAICLFLGVVLPSRYERGVGRVLGERRRRGLRGNLWKGFAVLCLAFGLTLLPWAIRNQRSLGSFIPTSTLVGANLYKGNHIPTQGAYFWSTDSLLTPEIRARIAGVSEAQQDRILRAEAGKMILSNKTASLLLALKKIPRLWLNLGYGRAPSIRSIALAAGHLALIMLAVYCLLIMPSDRLTLSFVPLTTVVFSSLAYLAVASEVRFVFPLVPLILPYSAFGLLAIGKRLRPVKSTQGQIISPRHGPNSWARRHDDVI